MAEQRDEQDNDARGTERVLGVMAAVVGGALVTMGAWGAWVLHWASSAGHEVPGTFGDSFAPIVGLMTAGALGAAIASVFMQRRELELQRQEMKLQRQEMRDAREQYTAQAAALVDANKHAAQANDLARSAQVLEAERQIAELDALGIAAIQALKDEYESKAGIAGLKRVTFGDVGAMWFEFVDSAPARRAQHCGHFNTVQLRELAARRERLNQTLVMQRDQQNRQH